MTVRHKHESFNHMMNRFDRYDHRFGNVRDYMRTDNRQAMGHSKKRQLKSKNARSRSKAMRRRNRRRHRVAKSREARQMY